MGSDSEDMDEMNGFAESEDDYSEYGDGEHNDDPDQADDSGDGAKLFATAKEAELAELEKEYTNLRDQDEDILRNLRKTKEDDVSKSQAVKNQKALWNRILEVRILLQKAFTNSNRLPKEPLRSEFCVLDKATNQAYTELAKSARATLDSCLELQEELMKKNPMIDQAKQNGVVDSSSGSDHVWEQVQRMHSRIASFRDGSIDKWQRKTQLTTGSAAFKSKLRAFDQSISQQVASYMRDPSRMIKRMQLRRSSLGVIGDVSEASTKPAEEDETEMMDGDPELVDDSEFYQQLLKEFLESVSPDTSGVNALALRKAQSKKRKLVDRRASKSRKIRYHVHEKLVNFMAPETIAFPDTSPKLFENLFGLKSVTSS